MNNLKKAETSILRYASDKYRSIIFDAQVYANTGSGTPQQAIDMATHDFLQSGINNIEYANGARVNIKSYVEMAIRTANSRAHMQGEGEKRCLGSSYCISSKSRRRLSVLYKISGKSIY